MIGHAAHDFDLALYAQLRGRAGNSFFSPFSIRAALGMALAGARGETAEQIRAALGGAGDSDEIHEELGSLFQRLSSAAGGTHEMAVANSLWSQSGAPVVPQFRELIARYYAGGFHPTDFRNDAEGARHAINAWTAGRTKERIRNLIPPGMLRDDTRLVLANAVYFKGKWSSPFYEPASMERAFHVEGGGRVDTMFMQQKRDYPHVRGNGFQAVELTYEGDAISMLILLPDDRDGLSGLERGLTPAVLRDCLRRLSVQEVRLWIPRFEVTWATNLFEALLALGMRAAFDPDSADFSGINGLRPPDAEALHISAAVHRAFVEVNEQGTEAAAATAIAMEPLSADFFMERRAIEFVADHPFLFAILERKSGAILFLGRLCDPTVTIRK